MKTYKVEYWYQWNDSYEFGIADVEAISPKQAIKKATEIAPRNAKSFKILN